MPSFPFFFYSLTLNLTLYPSSFGFQSIEGNWNSLKYWMYLDRFWENKLKTKTKKFVCLIVCTKKMFFFLSYKTYWMTFFIPSFELTNSWTAFLLTRSEWVTRGTKIFEPFSLFYSKWNLSLLIIKYIIWNYWYCSFRLS